MQATTPASTQSFWKVFAILGALTVLCCMGVLCYSAALFYIVDNDISLIPAPTLNLACTDTTCLNVCLRRLPDFEIAPLGNNRAELAKRVGGIELARYRLDEQTGQFVRVATPTVPDYLKPYQADTALHQRIGNYFTGIFPSDSDMHISYMVVYMNSAPQHFSALIQDLDGKWQLHVNLFDIGAPRNLIEVLTHEYAHMLTLNKNQVRRAEHTYRPSITRSDFDKLRTTCNGRFYTGVSCALDEAYLNAFGNRFWTGEVYESWIEVFFMVYNNPAGYRTALDEFYANHREQFVSPYAATNPREDIAESWTEFILRPKPSGTSIADQKVLFFYEFPELVQTREEIIQGVCQYAVD